MKIFLITMLGAITMQTLFAQSQSQPNYAIDKWYIGAQYGVNTKTTHNNDYLKNVNASAGLRIGYNITPTFGFMAEGTAFFGDVKFGASKCFVKALNADLLAVVNLSNLLYPISGKRHFFEARLFGGAGINHIFGYPVPENNNDLISKLGLDLGINLGSNRQWYVYLQPAINYNLDHYSRTQYNINYSALQASIGINYHFLRKYHQKGQQTNVVPQVIYIQPTQQETAKQTVNEKKAEKAEIAATTVTATPKKIYEVHYLKSEPVKEMPAVIKKEPYVATKREAHHVVAKNETPAAVKKEVPAVVKKQTTKKTASSTNKHQLKTIAEVVSYMKSHPKSNVIIRGNKAEETSKQLIRRYNINSSRISVVEDSNSTITFEVD